MSRILARRGNRVDLPALNAGEPGVAVDTKQAFFGTNSTQLGNIALPSIVAGGHKIQSGSTTVTTSAAAGNYTSTVTFPNAFAASPIAVANVTFDGAPDLLPAPVINAISATSMQICQRQNDAQVRTMTLHWIAIGP